MARGRKCDKVKVEDFFLRRAFIQARPVRS
jgi:hypothetical protein